MSSKLDFSLSNRKKHSLESKDNIWTSILTEVQTKGSSKLPSNKQILVLGNNKSGKTTLIAKLQGVENLRKGSPLEYAYIDVRDDYGDDHARLSVWVLDGNPALFQFIKFALPAEAMRNSLIMLVASMATPWGVLDQLQNWVQVLQDHIDSLKIPVEIFQEYQRRIVNRWQEYSEECDNLDIDHQRTSKTLECEMNSLPLTEGVLSSNLGLDIMVVITKTDYMLTLEKENDYRNEHFDFIQQRVRRFCLTYGASLFYTSVKDDKNCDLLYKYLTHRVYGLPFHTPALIVEKEALFIPAGWDSTKKISIVCDNLLSMKPDDDYKSVIGPPKKSIGWNWEDEIVAEDEQVFLSRMMLVLQQEDRERLSMKSPATRPSLGVPNTNGSSMLQPSPVPAPRTSPKKVDSPVVTLGRGEGALINFFNSLLLKKPSSPVPSKASGCSEAGVEAADLFSEAAAKLAQTQSIEGEQCSDKPTL